MKSRYIVILGCAAVILIAALLFTSAIPERAKMDELIELPRPNSGAFTFEQAEARKGEIYRMKLTGRLADWELPEKGFGFCVHITKADSIIVEHFRLPFSESKMERWVRDRVEALTGNRYVENPSHVYRNVSLADLDQFLKWEGMSAAFIVLTSEREPRQSTAFPEVLDRLFKPSIMLHYVPEKQQIESGPRE